MSTEVKVAIAIGVLAIGAVLAYNLLRPVAANATATATDPPKNDVNDTASKSTQDPAQKARLN